MTTDPTLQRPKILVIDDDENIRLLLSRALAASGDCTVASNGVEGIARLIEDSYDVVILDLVMAGGSGVEVLEFVRGLALPPQCIILSALGEAWAKRTNDTQRHVVLSKPVDVGMLQLAVARMLARRSEMR